MNWSMRYRTAKLSQLVHQQKSYNLHMNSVDKIMNQSNNQFFRRSRQLSQLKSRKIQAYNHTQSIRSKEIGYVNGLLFTKICKSTLIKKEDSEQPFEELQEKIQFREAEMQAKIEDIHQKRHFVLRNHRQSPIHKSTLLERTRENIRLAKKIVQPNYLQNLIVREIASNRENIKIKNNEVRACIGQDKGLAICNKETQFIMAIFIEQEELAVFLKKIIAKQIKS